MISIGHIAAGYIVGNIVSDAFVNPATSFTFSFLGGLCSHYVLDFVPHGHFGRKAEFSKFTFNTILIYADLFGGLFLFTALAYNKFLFSHSFFSVLISIFASILPDLVSLFNKIVFGKNITNKFFKMENDFHSNTHWHGKGSKTLILSARDVWQLTVVLIAIFF